MSKPRQTRKKSPAKGRKYKIKSVKNTSVLRPFLTVICGILLGFSLVFLFLLNPASDTAKRTVITLPDNARNFISEKLFADNNNATNSPNEQTASKPTTAEDVSQKSTDYADKDSEPDEDEDEDEEYEEDEDFEYAEDEESDESADTTLTTTQPVKPAKKLPLWQKNAAPVDPDIPQNAPIVAIIIDDIGLDQARSKEITSIQAPLTLSFITYAKDLIPQIQSAKQTGKELMLHIPMQPSDMTINDGPNSLNIYMSEKDISDALNSSISKEILNLGIAGANNHMGSKFTSNKNSISAFMHIFKQYDIYFIDSVTHKDSYASESATAEHIATAKRDIFIDNVDDEKYILGQLSKLEKVAKRKGYAIGIGHPHDGTVAALKNWIPTLKAKGIYLVPASAVVKRRLGNM